MRDYRDLVIEHHLADNEAQLAARVAAYRQLAQISLQQQHEQFAIIARFERTNRHLREQLRAALNAYASLERGERPTVPGRAA